jgi:uncharacterized membrane protein
LGFCALMLNFEEDRYEFCMLMSLIDFSMDFSFLERNFCRFCMLMSLIDLGFWLSVIVSR